MDIRERARKYLLQVPPFPGEVASNGVTAALFTKLTGITHNQLLISWGMAPRPPGHPNEGEVVADPPPGLTSCNSFVANYAGNAGIGIGRENRSMGQFGLDKKLKAWKKEYAWVPATEGARPKYGDIFELAGRLHQGISLDFEGDIWNTAEGGQGGKSTGYDIVKRKRSKQEGNVLVHDKGGPRGVMKGWVDIELFADGPRPPPPTTMPDWLLGWWSVPWRGQVFHYFFDTGFKVSWTLAKPISTAFVPMNFNDTASVTFDGPESMTLKWSKTGSVEKLARTSSGREMAGRWNETDQIIATKLL